MPRLLIAVIFLAAALILGFGYVRPEWRDFQALGSQIGEIEEISREFDELIANRDQLLDKVNTISKEDLARLDRMLPSGPHASDFLTAIEAITIEGGVALRRIDLASPEAAKTEAPPVRPGASPQLQPRPASALAPTRELRETSVLPFSVQVSGSYPAFKNFLAGMERNMRLIDVEDISFNSGGKAEIIDFSVKAKTYYQ